MCMFLRRQLKVPCGVCSWPLTFMLNPNTFSMFLKNLASCRNVYLINCMIFLSCRHTHTCTCTMPRWEGATATPLVVKRFSWKQMWNPLRWPQDTWDFRVFTSWVWSITAQSFQILYPNEAAAAPQFKSTPLSIKDLHPQCCWTTEVLPAILSVKARELICKLTCYYRSDIEWQWSQFEWCLWSGY